MGEACSKHRGEESCIRVLAGKPERKRPLGRPRRRLEDNIKMDLQVVGWEHGLDRSGSGQGQLGGGGICKDGNKP